MSPGADPGYRRHRRGRAAGRAAAHRCRAHGQRHCWAPSRLPGPGRRIRLRAAWRPGPARAGRRSRRGHPPGPGRHHRTRQRGHRRSSPCDPRGRPRRCPAAVRVPGRGPPRAVSTGRGTGVHELVTEPGHPHRTAGRPPARLDGVPHRGHAVAHRRVGPADASPAHRRPGALPGLVAEHRPHRRGGPRHAGHHQHDHRVAAVASR